MDKKLLQLAEQNRLIELDLYNSSLSRRDLYDIADVIIRFLSLDRNERLKMARRSREIAESLFDKQKFLKGYMDLINS